MVSNYIIYAVDTETTGLDEITNDIIEISLLRYSDGVQKTWLLKPIDPKEISIEALRVNKHNIEDLLHQTKQGKELYRNPSEVIVEIENWINEDNVPTSNRCLVGHNVGFDIGFLKRLWEKCNSSDTFPFGKRYLDTMQIQFFMDLSKSSLSESYSLSNTIKRYGIKNDKAHTAAADTKATKELLDKQINYFQSLKC